MGFYNKNIKQKKKKYYFNNDIHKYLKKINLISDALLNT